MAVYLTDFDEYAQVDFKGKAKAFARTHSFLSEIIRTFNDLFGSIEWVDEDNVQRVIAEDITAKVAADTAYQNAIRNSDKQNARVEHDRALRQAIADLVLDHTEIYKQFEDNPSFKQWLSDFVFRTTYQPPSPGPGESRVRMIS